MTPAEQEHHSIHVGEPDSKGRRITPWAWVPSVYFLQGLQYVIVIQLFVIIYFTMGVPSGKTLLLVGLLQLPWTLKPLWGPLVDRYGSKRAWTFLMQFIVGAGFLITAFAMQLPAFVWITFAILMLVAFAAATHDIACDGYYMLGLNERQQAFHVGVRSTFFRIALIVANGLLVWIAGLVQARTGLTPVQVRIDASPAAAIATVPDPAEVQTGLAGIDDNGQQRLIIEPPVLTVAAGETTTFTVKLAQPVSPGETQVVSVQSAGGLLDLIGIGPLRFLSIPREAGRLEFNDENWDKGIEVVVKVDPGLHKPITGRYQASAGNVAFSWAVVLGLCGMVFGMLALYHSVFLPYPKADIVQIEGRPPFYVPLFALGVTVGVPTALAYGIFYLIGMFSEPLANLFIGEDPTATARKGFNVFFTLGRMALITAIGAVIFIVPAFWKPTRSVIYKMSDISGIGFAEVFASFFSKPNMAIILGFLLTFRLGEAQLASVKNIFLLDELADGGLALTYGQFVFVNTAVYLLALTIGGILGGFLIAGVGLKKVIWFMVAAMHLPNLLYIWLAVEQPQNLGPINIVVFAESFGYGFGFAAYLMVMILAAQGAHKTAHYAICTGAMALGYMVPSMWSGYLQELIGYTNFFIAVMVFVIPGTLLVPFLPIDPKFGRKQGS